MNLRLQRFIDRYVGVPLCAALTLLERVLPRRRPRACAPGSRRVAVILLSEMGSLVLAHALFARLRERFPEGGVHVVLFKRNREVLDLMQVVNPAGVVEVDDASPVRLVLSLARAVLALRRIRPDVVLDCELFARVSSVLSFVSGAPVRVGFDRGTQEGLYRGGYINRPVLYNPYHHISRQYLALADAIDSQARPAAKHNLALPPLAPPPVSFTPGDLDATRERLHADFPTLRGRPLVLLYPSGGLLPIRAWPLDRYRALAAALCDQGYAVGVIGAEADRALGVRLADAVGRPQCVSLAGYTRSIGHLLRIFHHAAILVGNDGGPGQFAALTPVPTLTLFGPETPALYGSHARNAHVLHLALPCSPCLTAYNHRASPCDGDNQCLKQIEVAEVVARVRTILATRDTPAHRGDARIAHA